MPPPPAIPGYQLLHELGRGGMGIVWLARQLALDRLVAIKMLLSRDAVDRERFRREGDLLKDLAHPNLVRLLDHDVDAAEPYLVLEYVEHARTFVRVIALDKPLHSHALTLVLGATEALAHVHERGIVHRDIKPGNILIGPDGRPRLIDLGLARPIDAAEFERLTGTGEVMGTCAYMAPEQMVGGSVDARSDVYSMGLVLYELLARRLIFATSEVGGVLPQRRLCSRWPAVTQYSSTVHADVAAVVARCLMFDPRARYASGAELAAALQRLTERPTRRRAVTPLAITPAASDGAGRDAAPEPAPPPSTAWKRASAAVAFSSFALWMVAALLAAWGPGIFLPGGSSKLLPAPAPHASARR